jgi:hypothetical protein
VILEVRFGAKHHETFIDYLVWASRSRYHESKEFCGTAKLQREHPVENDGKGGEPIQGQRTDQPRDLGSVPSLRIRVLRSVVILGARITWTAVFCGRLQLTIPVLHILAVHVEAGVRTDGERRINQSLEGDREMTRPTLPSKSPTPLTQTNNK